MIMKFGKKDNPVIPHDVHRGNWYYGRPSAGSRVFDIFNVIFMLFMMLSLTLIPPDVIIASSIGLTPVITIFKCLISFTIFFLSSLVISFTLL